MALGTWLRTLRHLRWSQLFWRLRYQLERSRRSSPRQAARWSWHESRLPRLRADFPVIPFFHEPPHESLPQLEQGIFHHFHESRTLGREKPDWLLGPVTTGRLWCATLHYHAWLYALVDAGQTELARSYLDDWIARCSLEMPGSRELAWNAYVIATRLTWWTRAYQRRPDSFADTFLRSLWQQANYLHDHLEWDLRANHLLRDAVGLAWAGRFFAEPQAQRWLATATELALAQVQEQVLPDGGHFERSPMYHQHVMEDLRALALLVEDPAVRAILQSTYQKMEEYLTWMRHPDGDIALFNDAGLAGCASDGHSYPSLVHPANPQPLMPTGGRHFEHSGMVVWHGNPWSVFFDVGCVGPDYQPGHAHADTLSLECSFRGKRLFVDPGTHSYDNDDRRRYDRSTAAHNTVCIDGQDSSEVWHIFRVGRRAYPINLKVGFMDLSMTAEASHTGYDHLPGHPHHRRWISADNVFLQVEDVVLGYGRHVLEGGWLCAPGWSASVMPYGWQLTNGRQNLRIVIRGSPELNVSVEQKPYHPTFGVEVLTTRLNWRTEASLPYRVTTVVGEI